MTDLFTFAEAKARRDVGMERAAGAQGHCWAALAYQAIKTAALRQPHVHVDDILAQNIPQPEHPNAWGAVWMRAIRNGIIQHSNQSRPCKTDKRKHAHRYPVYFSRIHDPR
jgi:hypothetical protein